MSKYLKRYKEHPDRLREEGLPVDWHETTRAETILRLSEWWKPQEILKMLNEGQTLWTPFAEFKMEGSEKPIAKERKVKETYYECPVCGSELEEVTDPDARTVMSFMCHACQYKY